MLLMLTVSASAATGSDGGGASATAVVVIINGVQKTLAPGEQPQLNPGDKVSVVSGNVTFLSPGGDKINANGAGAAFSISPNDSLLSVNYTGGNVSVTDSKGHTDNLSAANPTTFVATAKSFVFSDAGLSYTNFVSLSVPTVEQQKCLSGSTPGASGC